MVTSLLAAWQRLRVQLGGDLATLLEDQTTVLLEAELNALLDSEDVPGFSREFFAVQREPKVVNYDGNHPDKMPDLVFLLNRRHPGIKSEYALHAECKPVNSQIFMSPYCGTNGMGRFIRGDYASTMRSGLMIAYAEAGYSFGGKILPVLQKTFGTAGDPYATTRLAFEHHPPESHHHRSWRYANGIAPGDIRLVHVWLTV